jgi:hypothetical protein
VLSSDPVDEATDFLAGMDAVAVLVMSAVASTWCRSTGISSWMGHCEVASEKIWVVCARAVKPG